MPSNDLLTDASEGAVKGFLNWTKEQVKELAFRLQNRDIVFIKEKEDIEQIKLQRKTAEWEIYKKFIKNRELRILCQLGVSLRRWESNQEKLKYVRNKINAKFGSKGLHIANFIQNDFLNKYLGAILAKVGSSQELTIHIEEILNNVDKYAVFIKEEDDVERRSTEIITRIQANVPGTFVMSSRKSAMSVAKSIQVNVKKVITGYESEEFQDNNRYICFFNRELKTEIDLSG